MRRFFGLLFAILACWGAWAQTPPPPQHWVTDGPALLSSSVRERLDLRLAAYEKATGHQVLVWIGESTEGIPLEDWTVRTFESWGVGRKGRDDGVVLFLFARDRKVRIEVGYGLEGQLPDATASRIIQEAIIPNLKSGSWDDAVSAGVDQILGTLEGEVTGDARPQAPPARSALGLGQIILFSVLGLAFLILLITNPSLAIWLLFSLLSGGRGGGRSSGGGWSGGGGRSGGGGASGSW